MDRTASGPDRIDMGRCSQTKVPVASRGRELVGRLEDREHDVALVAQ